MIELYTTPTFDALFISLPKPIQIKANKKKELFCNNPYYPGLRTEKLHPKNLNAWSFRVDIHYRIIFEFISQNRVVFKFIGHHNDIYRML